MARSQNLCSLCRKLSLDHEQRKKESRQRPLSLMLKPHWGNVLEDCVEPGAASFIEGEEHAATARVRINLANGLPRL